MTVEPFKVQAGETYSRFDGGVTQPLRAVVVKGESYFQDGHGHIYDSNGYPLAWRDPDHIRNVNDRLVAAYKPSDQQKDEPAWKLDAGKPRIELIAPEFITTLSEVLTFGAQKYGDRNWEKGMTWGRCFGAMMRHAWAWWRGEDRDPESGLPHLAHAAACLMFLLAFEQRKIGVDDRK
jgi:Domain of unknown function (DUF5664)